MHLEQINYFLTLGRVLNFTKTAEMLYVSQPTISRQIRLLEDELGMTLFYRTGNSVSLTPKGSFLYEKFDLAYKTIQDSIKEAEENIENKKGVIMVGAPLSIGYGDFLTHCHGIFAKEYPDVDFVYEKADFLTLREKLETDELDVIMTMLSKPYHAYNTTSIPLFESSGALIFKKGDPRGELCQGDLGPFSGDSLICLQEGISARGMEILDRICEESKFKYKRAIRVPNLESAFFYVQAGLGVALLDKSIINIDPSHFDFVEIPGNLAKLTIVAAYKETNPSPWVSAFVEIIEKEKKHFV